MKLLLVLLVGAVAGIVPALAQTSSSTSTQPPDGSRSGRPSSDLSDKSLADTADRRSGHDGDLSGNRLRGYNPMGSGGYNPMGHK